MTDAERFLDGYLDAWRTNDPAAIRALFAPDATYRDGVDGDPIVGIEGILALWDDQQDEQGTWSFDGSVEVENDTGAVIRGVTTYSGGATQGVYDNVWLVRFGDDGRAVEFQDWWFERA